MASLRDNFELKLTLADFSSPLFLSVGVLQFKGYERYLIKRRKEGRKWGKPEGAKYEFQPSQQI